MSIVIERLIEPDIDGLFEFRSRVFPKNSRQLDRDRWAWLYINNPSSNGKIPVWVLKSENRIVGSIASTDTRVKVGDHTFLASFGNDYYVEKEYLGLASLRLLKTMLAEYQLNIAANLSESARRLFKQMKYSDLSSSLDMMTLPLLPANSLRSIIKLLVLSAARKLSYPTAFESVVFDNVPELMPELWGRIANSQRVTIIKDKKYLEWRYGQCPSTKFKFISIMGKGHLRGVAVVTKFNQQGVIMDLLVPAGENAILHALMQESLNFFKRAGCTESYAHVSGNWSRKVFALFGFYRGISDIGLMVHAASKDLALEEAKDPALWHFNLGDTDRI